MINGHAFPKYIKMAKAEYYITEIHITVLDIQLTLGDRNSRASCEATGEETGEAVAGGAGDLLGEEAGMVDRVDMLLGEGELVSGAAS